MSKLRIGIIGTGGIAGAHMYGYQDALSRGEIELAACCDIDVEKAKRFAEKYGFAKVYADYNEMMANEKLDCVSVTTWNAAHCGATCAALRGGANVICEKPMAMNAKEAELMMNTAKECDKLLQVGFVRRFGKDADAVKCFAKAGELGDIYYAKACYLRRDGCPGGWFADKEYSGGGPLIDLGVHVIDLVRYLAGCPKPVSAYGVTYDHIGSNRAENAISQWDSTKNYRDFKHNVEDFASALIRFDNGLTLQLEASFNLNIAHDTGKVQIFGTKAGVDMSDGIEISGVQAGLYVNTKPIGDNTFDFVKAFIAEINGFLSAAQGKTECRATAEDGVQLMKILDAVYESARTGKLVEIAQ